MGSFIIVLSEESVEDGKLGGRRPSCHRWTMMILYYVCKTWSDAYWNESYYIIIYFYLSQGAQLEANHRGIYR